MDNCRAVKTNAARRPMVVFDLDQTITRITTFTPFIFRSLKRRRQRLLALPAIAAAGTAYAANGISMKRLKEIMLRVSVAGRTAAEIAALAEDFAARTIAEGCHPEALAEIAARRREGAYLVLATASMDFYARVFGRRLGFDHVLSTRSSWSADGRLDWRIAGENCYGAAKLASVQALAADLGLPLKAAYSDHHSDLPLLLAAEDGTVVNGSLAARRLAARHGFRLVDWRR